MVVWNQGFGCGLVEVGVYGVYCGCFGESSVPSFFVDKPSNHPSLATANENDTVLKRTRPAN